MTALFTGPDVYVVTGAMAVGKTTVSELLARRYERSVHLRGDAFRTMIVSGREPITPAPGREALRQLDVRRRIAAKAANEYRQEGFAVVLQDVYAGRALADVVERLEASPLYVVVLAARPDVLSQRERDRQKVAYGDWRVEDLSAAFERGTPRIGLWLDTSDLDPDRTVEEILRRREAARVR